MSNKEDLKKCTERQIAFLDGLDKDLTNVDGKPPYGCSVVPHGESYKWEIHKISHRHRMVMKSYSSRTSHKVGLKFVEDNAFKPTESQMILLEIKSLSEKINLKSRSTSKKKATKKKATRKKYIEEEIKSVFIEIKNDTINVSMSNNGKVELRSSRLEHSKEFDISDPNALTEKWLLEIIGGLYSDLVETEKLKLQGIVDLKFDTMKDINSSFDVLSNLGIYGSEW
jgi:hypothetical protein